MASYKARMLLDANMKDYFLIKGIKPSEVEKMKSVTLYNMIEIDEKKHERMLFQRMAEQNNKISHDSVQNIQRMMEQQNNARKPRNS